MSKIIFELNLFVRLDNAPQEYVFTLNGRLFGESCSFEKFYSELYLLKQLIINEEFYLFLHFTNSELKNEIKSN